MSTVSSARLLIVEDDLSIRSALLAALQNEGYKVQAEADGSRLDEVVVEFRPDLAILDVRLPVGPSGYDMGRALRGASDVPILFLTAAGSEHDRLTGFESGADDYLTKPFSMAELLARIHALLRRSGRLQSAVRQLGDIVIDDGARAVGRAGQPLDLTFTEFELLSVFARHLGQVLSRAQLLNQVWRFDGFDRTVVDMHISSLRKKMEAAGPRVVHTVRGLGYVLRI